MDENLSNIFFSDSLGVLGDYQQLSEFPRNPDLVIRRQHFFLQAPWSSQPLAAPGTEAGSRCSTDRSQLPMTTEA